MAEQNGLVEVVHRLVIEEDFRKRLVMAPKETLITELGISRENYEALIAVIPVLVAGGIGILGGGVPSKGDNWGGWGSR
jgi:hypothetical protein